MNSYDNVCDQAVSIIIASSIRSNGASFDVYTDQVIKVLLRKLCQWGNWYTGDQSTNNLTNHTALYHGSKVIASNCILTKNAQLWDGLIIYVIFISTQELLVATKSGTLDIEDTV